MWIFTKYGFYSAVCAREGDGGHDQAVATDRVMVRSRMREHLEALLSRFSDLLRDQEIRQFSGADYAFRIFVDKGTWSLVVAQLIEEMDYDNFKLEVAEFQCGDGGSYEHTLHEVWSVMYRLQKIG